MTAPRSGPARSPAGAAHCVWRSSPSIGLTTSWVSRASNFRFNRFQFPCPLERTPQDPTMNLTPKQLRIYDLVRQWRNDRGYSPTMQELADELGVSKVTVFEHVQALVEKGVLSRNPNKARSLALTVDDDAPIGRVAPSTDALTLPLLGRIAAGHPVEKFEQDETLSLGQVFGPARGRHNEMFALQVEGMSMKDESILDGDYVIVERRSTARNGDRVVALLPNGETTLKTFFRERDGRIRLQPANPEFEPIIVDECQVQGIVIGVMRRY
ncbi:MAG: transcriptional repressor LexA [Phycisphaerae bacterium]|nr:transcriptional repressor LexA [Phycisphaerae bacterium]